MYGTIIVWKSKAIFFIYRKYFKNLIADHLENEIWNCWKTAYRKISLDMKCTVVFNEGFNETEK